MNETFVLGLEELGLLCSTLPKEGIVLLKGNLAAGKTTLVEAYAKALHVKDVQEQNDFVEVDLDIEDWEW